jgi:protein involved in polysaccharide export with SLBB domain
VGPSKQHFLHRQRTTTIRVFLVLAGLLLLVSWPSPAARAQQQNSGAAALSDLALQNQTRVAASTADIKAVLGKDAGLLVELKHFLAWDATDHGQIVSDSDLTDNAIFERLETDIQFRSIATALLQRYGYLRPKLNPDSDSGKERELVLQERAKWLAQHQEVELTQARQKGGRNPQDADSCDAQIDKECNDWEARPSRAGGSKQGPAQQEPPPRSAPAEPDSPNLPNGNAAPVQRAQLMQTAEDSRGMSPQNSSPDSNDSARLSNGSNLGAAESFGTRARAGGPPEASWAGGNSDVESAGDGLLAAHGTGMNPGNGIFSDVRGNNVAASNPSASLEASPVAARQPPNRRSSTDMPAAPLEMIRKQNPYEGIPSLYDMYVQAVTRPVAPRRFGAEVFENGTRDSQLIPMDLPAGPDYVVGPGDALSVDLWGGVSQRLYRVVDREGRVSLPEVGPVLVSGKSLADVQQNLQRVLRTEFRDVSADVSLARLRTIRVYEVGDVISPGAYDISSLSTPLNALFAAGGPTSRGSMRILQHYRGTQLVQTVDVYDLLLHGVKMDLRRLENGDTVQIPPIGPQVTLEGMIRRPAIYELRDEKTLASVIELAGGLLPAAALRHIEVQRLVAHEKQTMLSVDIPEIENASEVAKKLESFEIQDGDRIRIYPIAPYNQDAIFLEGHVARPGRYSFHAGMRVTDVLSSYQDLLPEPAAQYAEIVRLNAPDFHPSVEGFDLAGALANPAQAPVLQAMDTLRIFSRFDFENPPAVSIGGDVRAPGTYQTSGQIRVSDAIHLAGGLTPQAETADAQVFRYLPDGELTVFSVSLSHALGGDPVANILLHPRDRLLIHRNPDAVEPATVYKHVPMMEFNVPEAVKNNVLALVGLLDLADQAGCKSFVMISSDKAVNPTSVMGATKRICELILASHPCSGMRCVSVRFGNVLGSSGSVIPVLKLQLQNHQPLTVTHPEIRRFFMMTREAVALVLQAFAIGSHGDILVLDMGEPIRILDLARNLIRLSGRSEQEVKIQFTGLRDGEKLEEQLFYQHEKVLPTSFDKIKRTHGSLKNWSVLCRQLDELRASLSVDGSAPIRAKMKEIVPEYCYEEASRGATCTDAEGIKSLEKAAGQKL